MAEAVLVQPDASLIREIIAMGGSDLKKCYQCGTCAVSCDLSAEDVSFPRRQMLAAQWGLRDRLMEDPGPWLCFYCGGCTTRCPRKANPGEVMMALRRYLTAQYDWTGLSGLMYRSAFWEIGALVLVAALVVLAFVLPHGFGFGLLAQSPAALESVNLGQFAPKEIVHIADRLLALLLGLLLLVNASRMFRALTRGKDIPLGAYLRAIPNLLVEAATQRRWRGCQDHTAASNWRRHLLLVTGYATIFTLVVVFLPWFQVEDSGFHWTSLLGYYAAGILLWSTASMLWDRARRRSEMHRFSELSDWLFPALLFLTALTGILLHAFRLSNWPMATCTMYVIHLAIAVPMLVVEVPFGKWAHLFYRPVAIYVAAVSRESSKGSSSNLGARSN